MSAVTANALEMQELLEPPTTEGGSGAGDAVINEGHAVSADGRFVVFTSFATNLVAGDSNGQQDVFVWDTVLDVVELISRANPELQANGDSANAVISADGQWIAFSSSADNLILDGNGPIQDVFLYSRATGEVTLVSQDSAGLQGELDALRPDINANGRYVTFDSASDLAAGGGTQSQVYRRDLWTGTTQLMSETPEGAAGDAPSMDAQMSADGEQVVFVSMATNLVPTPTVGKDSYLRDLRTNDLDLLTLTATGQAGDGISYFPSISGDGRFAAFHTNASNLVPDDRPEFADVVLREIASGEMTLLSRSLDGEPADNFNIHPSLSYDGQRIAFASNATNLVEGDAPEHVDMVLVDRLAPSINLLSQSGEGAPANGDSAGPSISFDGTSVAFTTLADNLTAMGTALSDIVVARIEPDEPVSPPALAAAILPSSRSVQLGGSLTAFAAMIGTGVAAACGVRLNTEFDSEPLVELGVQATDPQTNAVVGAADTPFLLLPGAPQTLLLTLTPLDAFSDQEIEFEFFCSEENVAPVIVGTNTLRVSAESTQPPDVVALVATLENNGIVSLASSDGSGFFGVATFNVGASAELIARPIVKGMALDTVSICQTDSATSVCLQDPSSSLSVTIESGATPTFAVFLKNAEPVPFSPAENRLTVQFEDAAGIVRGRAGVAVRSEPENDDEE